jgi:hypothetical protein
LYTFDSRSTAGSVWFNDFYLGKLGCSLFERLHSDLHYSSPLSSPCGSRQQQKDALVQKKSR